MLTYKEAGVDIEAGNKLVDKIKPIAKSTHREGVLGSIGGFGALFELPKNYKEPVLVAGTDGVGTKLRLGIDHARYEGLGIDLVAMCANDLAVLGAEPLFFLDYYATGELDIDVAQAVVQSIATGCKQAGAALIGGETAEMPGMYQKKDFDLAGFCVGVVEKSKTLGAHRTKDGDVLLGLSASGVHSNGFSLVRHIISSKNIDVNQQLGDRSLLDALIEPTKIYVKPVQALLKIDAIHAASHITGGGLTENLPRVLADDLKAVVKLDALPQTELFTWLQSNGELSDAEMLKTFNCGIGMVLVVPAAKVDTAIQTLADAGSNAHILGHLEKREANAEPIQFHGKLA